MSRTRFVLPSADRSRRRFVQGLAGGARHRMGQLPAQEAAQATDHHHEMPPPEAPIQNATPSETPSEAEHVPPEPPKHSMGPMPYEAMAKMMQKPEAEANLYGKADRERGLGSGLSDIEAALRLRYEIRREFAPYAGLVWSRRFGGTANFARAGATDVNDVQMVAGFWIWF